MRPLLLSLLAIALTTAPLSAQDNDDPDTGRLVPAFDVGGHVGLIHSLSFTPDGKRLISVSKDKTVQIWDTSSGAQLKVLRLPTNKVFQSLYWTHSALSPDGKTLFVAGNGLATGEKHLRTNYACLLNIDDGRIIMLPCEEGDYWGLFAVSFSADGNRAVVARRDRYDDEKSSTGYGLLSECGYLWSGLKGIWERKDHGAIAKPTKLTFTAGSKHPHVTAISPAGDRLAVAYWHSAAFDLLNLTKPGIPTEISHPNGGGVRGVNWSADGKKLASIHYELKGDTKNAVCLWSPTGKLLKTYPLKDVNGPVQAHHSFGIQFRNADELVLFNNHGLDLRFVQLLNLNDGTIKDVCRLPSIIHNSNAYAVSADGRYGAVAHGPSGCRVHLFELKEKATVRVLAGPKVATAAVGWSANGSSIGWNLKSDQTIDWALNLTELRPIRKIDAQAYFGAIRKRDDWEMVWEPGSLRSSVQVKNGGKQVAEVQMTSSLWSYSLPGGKGAINWFALATAHGMTIHDIASGKRDRVLTTENITAISPSPDGRYMLASSSSHSLYIVHVEKRSVLLKIFFSGHEWVIWTPVGGYYAASPGGEQLMGWTVDNGTDRVATFYPAEQFRKQLYRPDIIKLLLEKGSIAEAVKAADAARVKDKVEVPKGETDLAKMLPPGVTLSITSAKDSPKVTATVSARAAVPEQPIKSLKLLIDGRPLPERHGVLIFEPGQEKPQHEVSWEIELPPGKHKLSVLARSKDDMPSVSNTIDVATPVAEKDRPAVHHVAIGINAYDKPELTLKAARGDAERLAAGLASASKGGTAYKLGTGAILVDKEATRDAVLKAIDDVRKSNPKPNDLFVLSFAGHGDRKGGEFYLLTREADPTSADTLSKTTLAGSVLAEHLADFPCQVLLMLDACHSGEVAALRGGSDDAARALSDVDVRVAVMCAALGHEEAIEKDGAGLFSMAVVRALKHDPDAFFDKETGELNVYHLQAFVYQEVSKASDYRQTPFLKMPLAQPAFTVTRFPK